MTPINRWGAPAGHVVSLLRPFRVRALGDENPRDGDSLEHVRGGHGVFGIARDPCLELGRTKGLAERPRRLPHRRVHEVVLPAVPRWSWVEMKPGCCFMKVASSAQTLRKMSTSAGATLNWLMSTTGRSFLWSCCM